MGQDPSLYSIMLLVIYTSPGNDTGYSFLIRLKQQHAASKKIMKKIGERAMINSMRIKNHILRDSKIKRVTTTPF